MWVSLILGELQLHCQRLGNRSEYHWSWESYSFTAKGSATGVSITDPGRVTASLPKARQQVWVSLILGELQLHCQRLGNRSEYQWSSEKVWHAKEHSLLNDQEYRANVKPCTGKWDVFILVRKKSWVGRTVPNK